MYKSYPRMKNIQADLAVADIDLAQKIKDGGDATYNLIPTAVMITKNSATAEVQPLDCELRGGGRTILYLKINEIYEIAIQRIFQSGSSTDAIIILGEIN